MPRSDDEPKPEGDWRPEYEVEHLHGVMLDFARERIFDHAVAVMRKFATLRPKGCANECYTWPFARSLKEASLADEMSWVLKQNHVPDEVTEEFRSSALNAAERLIERLSDDERTFLIEARPATQRLS